MLSHIYEILDVPRRAQQVVSHENTPTVSIALPAYALLLDAWKELRRELPELSHYINLGILKIEEYVFKSRRSRIYAIAMGAYLYPLPYSTNYTLHSIESNHEAPMDPRELDT